MGKKLFLVLISLLLACSVFACSPSVDPGTDQDADLGVDPGDVETAVDGKFIVGFDQSFPPMGFVGDDGEFTGFDLELAAEVAERLDLELVLQPIAWDAKDMELSTQNIDCIWNGFTINDREDQYTWTDPYMSNNQVFVVKADAGITDLADLAGKTVMAQVDSSADKALAGKPDLKDTFGEYLTAADYLTALMDLESGAVDAVAMDDTFANYYIKIKGDNLVVLDETLSPEDYGIGFLLGNETLRDAVQTTLEEMAGDGTMAAISMKWFDKDITTIGK